MRKLVHRLLPFVVCVFMALPMAAQQGGKDDYLSKGDQFAAEGNLVEARTAYEQAIARGASFESDHDRSYTLGMAWKNGEPHDFAKAAKWLAIAVSLKPEDSDTRLQLAQALAWGNQYDAAVEQYRTLLKSRPGDHELTMELARTLSWAKRYRESLEIYDRLLQNNPSTEVRVERARVLSWSGRYDEAMRAYDGILASDPNNADALLGRAQVLYWEGKPQPALTIAEQLKQRNPKDPNVNFLLAALQHNLGNDAQALELLQLANQDQDSRNLRDAINRGTRPILHFGFGFQNDREEPTNGLASTYRTLRFTAGLEFQLTRRLRMEVSNTTFQNGTSTPVLAAFGADSIANQTMVRLSFSARPWLRMTVGGGEASTGRAQTSTGELSRQYQALYEIHPVVERGPFRLDFVANRTISPFTPLAVTTSLVQDRQTVESSYTLRKHVRFSGSYWHATYGLDAPDSGQHLSTSANGGSLGFSPIVISRENVGLDAGVRYELSQFSDETIAILDPTTGIGSSGVFMPRIYQRYYGTAHLWWSVKNTLLLDLDGGVGPQRVFGFAPLDPPPASWGMTGNFSSQLTLTRWRLQPYIGYSYFNTATPASPGLRQGSYYSHALIGGLRIRF